MTEIQLLNEEKHSKLRGKPVHEDITISRQGFLAEEAGIEEVMRSDVILRELVEEAAIGPPAFF